MIFKNRFFYANDFIIFKLYIPNTEFNSNFFFKRIYLSNIDVDDNEVEEPKLSYDEKNDKIKLTFASNKSVDEYNEYQKISGFINLVISESIKISIKFNSKMKILILCL